MLGKVRRAQAPFGDLLILNLKYQFICVDSARVCRAGNCHIDVITEAPLVFAELGPTGPQTLGRYSDAKTSDHRSSADDRRH
jgi:hypothetical protein